jgi:TrmH family RNA methyltransferase
MAKYTDFYIVGTALSNEQLSDIVVHPKMGVVVGNEGSGIKQSILEKTSINVTIPIDHIDSLNVGVAGSILMHHIKNNT